VKILATGADGMLGSYLPEDAVRTDVETLNVRDRQAVADALETHRPDFVFHLAAQTNVDLCEQQPEEAFRTNALGTQNVALACASQGATLVYVSTGSVFPGVKPEPYHEFDLPGPANLYAYSKHAGERFVLQLAPHSYIVRAGWMIGGGPHTEKKFIAKMLERAESAGKIVAVTDKWGSVTYGRDIMDSMLRLVETGQYGTYHLVNEGICTRYDIATEVNDYFGRPYEVEGVTSAMFPLPAPRPRSEALQNMMLRLNGWDWMRDWREALRAYLEAEWSDWRPGTTL
jgi:dTDP-4-dehydrorhamnose reductase